MTGWIKISRGIANHWLWQDAERLKWWLDLLFLAAWEEKRQLVGKQLVILQRGQLVASLSYLCKRWGRSRTMVESFLNLLIAEEMITKEVGRNISIITICNYDKYQTVNSIYLDADLKLDNSGGYAPSATQNDAHLDAHLDATNKEYKNIRNISISSNGESQNLKFIEELKRSHIWLEQMAMRFHITMDEVVKRLDDFALDLNCRGTEHRDFNDVRRHYNDWLRIQLEAEKRKQNYVSDRQKSENKRRGSDVTATSAEDYEGAF